MNIGFCTIEAIGDESASLGGRIFSKLMGPTEFRGSTHSIELFPGPDKFGLGIQIHTDISQNYEFWVLRNPTDPRRFGTF